MSDADNQTGGSGDRFSREDQGKGQRPRKEAEKGDPQGEEAGGRE